MRNFCLKAERFKENIPSSNVIFQDRYSTDSKDSDSTEHRLNVTRVHVNGITLKTAILFINILKQNCLSASPSQYPKLTVFTSF